MSMLMDTLQKKFEDMDQAELEDYFSRLRSRTRDKSTGAVKSSKKTKTAQLDKLLKSLSPEQIAAIFSQVKKG